MRQRRVVTALAIPLVLAFVAASCGSDDSSSDTDTGGDTTEAPDATDGEGGDDGGEPAATVPDVDTSVAEETEEAVYGGTVTIGLEADATGLRPWEDSCSSPCYTIMRSIYDPLFDQSAEGTYEPFLAESIESNDDFTVWTMTLRPDVTFHNGTPLTAQTIADMFPLQLAGAAGQSGITGASLEGVTAIDDLTVEYTLSAPNVAFPGALATAPIGFPFDPAAAAADSAGYSTNPIGTGPFVMANRDQDNETVVERNPDYWYVDTDGNQLPFLDSVSFRPTPDEGTRLDALLAGTTNAMQSLRQGTIRDAREESGIELIEFQGNSTGGGMFNTEQVPFDDVRVRTGLIYMNNQENVIEALGGAGISLPTSQFFSADSPWWTQEAEDAYKKFDFEAGKALIQEYVDDPARSDGKAPGEKIDVELSCPPDPTLIAAMQVAEQVWTRFRTRQRHADPVRPGDPHQQRRQRRARRTLLALGHRERSVGGRQPVRGTEGRVDRQLHELRRPRDAGVGRRGQLHRRLRDPQGALRPDHDQDQQRGPDLVLRWYGRHDRQGPGRQGLQLVDLPGRAARLGDCARGAGPLVPGLHRRVIQRSLTTH